MKAMSTSAVLVFLFGALVGAQEEPIEISRPIQISPHVRDMCLFNEMGIVPGSRNCGGDGKKVSIRHEKCITGGEPPCNLPADGTGRVEFVFIPSQNTTGLGVNANVIIDGQKNTYETLLPELSVEAGRVYALTLSGGATKELLGKHFTTQLEIFRIGDMQVEACTEQDHYVVS